jgi:polyisoprenyl-phosphate glycosyltransferase
MTQMNETKWATVPDISVVMPCLNEQENVRSIAEAVAAELEQVGATFEIIFIDNGSSDGTEAILRQLCAEDRRIRAIFNNRNYGQMRSPTYGIYQARGRAVVGMCSDFQDPPAMLGAFIERWKCGAKIVLGVRRMQGRSWIAAAGYSILGAIGDYRIIPGATGFGLYDRAVVDCLKEWNEPEPFFRGMLVESGFRLETIVFDRPGRAGGRSKNNVWTLLAFSLSALASSSKALLRLPLLLGLGSFAVAAILAGASAIAAIVGASTMLPVILAVVSFYFGIGFLTLGVMGEQLRLIAERSRNTPLVIERERLNFPDGRA